MSESRTSLKLVIPKSKGWLAWTAQKNKLGFEEEENPFKDPGDDRIFTFKMRKGLGRSASAMQIKNSKYGEKKPIKL